MNRSASITEPLEDEQSAQLLARANLQRMRQQWDEAMTSSMQVLYHEPDNWRAHALLGDIFSDLGRSEEAIQWYCMTLDIRPESQSVRDKLSSLVNSRRREIVGSLDPTMTLMDRTGKLYLNNKRGRWSWYWSAPERRRLATICVVILVVVCAVSAPARFGSRSVKSASEGLFTSGQTPTNTTLVLTPLSSANTTSPNSSTSQPPTVVAANPAQASAATIPQPAYTPTGEVRDSNDAALTASLQNDAALRSRSIQVSDAQIDPSSQKLTVTFLALGSAAAGEQTRDLQDSVLVARAALMSTEAASLSSVTLRCLSLQQQVATTAANIAPAAALTFIGTVTRSTANAGPADPTSLTIDQLGAYFADTWWQQSATPQS